jgi:hypothetical protein
MKRLRTILAVALLTCGPALADPARELSLPPSSTVPDIEEMRKSNEVGVNPEWNADEIGMDIDTYLAEDRGFKILQLFIRQDAEAADYVLVRDTQEVGVKPGWDEQPSQIATISESDGVRFHRYEDGRFASFENVRRTAEELRAAADSPPLRSTPP